MYPIPNTEILSSARILGIKLPEQQHLLHIAKEYLLQPTPEQYQTLSDDHGEYFYRSMRTGEIRYEHPCDQEYRGRVIRERKERIRGVKKGMSKISLPKSRTAFVDSPFRGGVEGGAMMYDDQLEPVQHVFSRKGSNKSGKPVEILKQVTEDIEVPLKPATKERSKKAVQSKNQVKKQKIKMKVLQERPGNPELVEMKKKQIEQTIRNKYRRLHQNLQQQYVQVLKATAAEQRRLKQSDISQLQQHLGNKLQRRKKQIQMQVMMQHTSQLDKMRSEADRQHKKDISMLGAKYNIEGLFTEMAECRKFLNRDKTQSERNHYMDEIDKNISQLNRIQVQKNVAEIQKQSRAEMHQIINRHIKNGNGSDWKTQQQIRSNFNTKLNKIFCKYQTNKEHKLNQIQYYIPKSTQSKQQNQQLFSQLYNLEHRLRQPKDQAQTQRSNMSTKQVKLVDLLQNRISPVPP